MSVSAPLAIHQLTQSFDTRIILDNLNLTLNTEEIFGLIGLNGIGKTTLIKTILSLIHSHQGDISFFGDPHHAPKSRQHLFYLPEKLQPAENLKGEEYLRLTLSWFHTRYQRDKAEELAASLHLKPEMLREPVRKYSKGMTQKLGLIAALLADRPLLILDEPMSGLDPAARNQLKTQLMAYRRRGHTIFFSSHILADIDEICDRIAILHDTKIRFLGTPQELKTRHQNATLEACFLSEINLHA